MTHVDNAKAGPAIFENTLAYRVRSAVFSPPAAVAPRFVRLRAVADAVGARGIFPWATSFRGANPFTEPG